MGVIVKIGVEEYRKFDNKKVTCKIDKKNNNVFFRLVIDSETYSEGISMFETNIDILSVTYVGVTSLDSAARLASMRGVVIDVEYEVGMNVTEEDVCSFAESTSTGVTALIKLPSEYNNMEFIYRMSQAYKNVRFCGGNLFTIEGCSLGCSIENRLKKASLSQYEGVVDSCCIGLVKYELEDLKLEVSDKVKVGTISTAKPGKRELFSSLLYANGKVEL